jgi:hypothetical protein
MSPKELQQWISAHGQPLVADGVFGTASRAALKAVFTNRHADATSDADIAAFAARLGCTTKQLRAVSKVESGGSGFDVHGRPKILFERHLFHRFTNGKYSVSNCSNPKGGGYKDCSWQKLGEAAAKSPFKAFESVSWGKFQVLGMWWDELGYSSPLEMAYSTVASEDAHYEMLVRYIELNKMQPAVRALSANPETNRAFARGYNGPAYTKFRYDDKLAEAMR